MADREAKLDLLEGLPVATRRVSMGVQTFDPVRVEAMGRSHLGAPAMVERAVAAAHRRGMTTSADLMINLPGQTLEEMKADVQRASDLGFSQICVYHLVLFRGLGTPWSRDREMLAGLPDNEQAFRNWSEVRQLVLDLGYRQTTLTNFEREGHYRYEECSYRPETFDGVGFGPEALSCYTDMATLTGVKWMNEASGADYRAAMALGRDARARCFVYGAEDLRLLYLTRTLPRMQVAREPYRLAYGTDLVGDFAAPLEALRKGGLVEWDTDALHLTPRGMFYADSVAGLLAADRVGQLRQAARVPNRDGAPVFRMG